MALTVEDNDEKCKGTIQYWLEVHRIGSLLFQNIKSGDNALKSLTTSIIETPLLSDIECLTGDEANETIVSPFTAWLLEGFFKASTCNSLAHLRTFYTVSQSKLLISCFERDLYAFEKHILCYIEFIEKVLAVNTFPVELKFLLKDDIVLLKYSKVLPSTAFEIANDREHFDYIVTLIEIIRSVLHLINYYCTGTQLSLWKIILILINSNLKGINYLVVPLLSEMLNSCDIKIVTDNMFQSILKSLQNIFLDPSLPHNSVYQQSICHIWTSIKEIHSTTDICNKSFVRSLLHSNIFDNKKYHILKTFLISELSIILFEQNEGENVFEFLSDFQGVSFNDKIHLSLNCVINELKENIEGSDRCSMVKKQVNAIIVSPTWKKIVAYVKVLLENDDGGAAKSRLESFFQLVKFCWKVIFNIESSFEISRKIDIYFFDELFCEIVEKILSDLHHISCQQEKALQLAMETLSVLLNLPEVQSHPAEKYKQVLDFIIQPLTFDKFQIFGFNNLSLDSEIPFLFLKCLRSIPLGTYAKSCFTAFSKCALLGEHNKCLTIEVVKSVPILFLNRRISPSKLITDILLPVALQENKEFLSAVIDSTVDLTCALVGGSHIKRDKNYELNIHCSECLSENTSFTNQNDLSLVKSHILNLISKISLEESYVKKKLLQSLPRLANHLPLFSNIHIVEKLLSFLCDKDEEVRQLLSKNLTAILLGRNWQSKRVQREDNNQKENVSEFQKAKYSTRRSSPDLLKTLHLILQRLEELIHLSLNSKDHNSMQGTLLETLISVGCMPISEVLSKSIRLLLLYIGQPGASLSTILMDITAAHNTTPLLLYYSFRPEISHFLGNLVAVNRIQYKQSLQITLSEVTSILKGVSEPRLAAGSENYVIPVLILWATRYQEAEDLLEEWSSFADQPLLSILTRSFHAIYTFISLNESQETFEKCIAVVERLTDLKLTELVMHSQKLIVNQLLFNYHRAPGKVLIGLKKVIGLPSESNKQEVAESLESRFVGYLLFIVSKFVKEINADSEKMQAIHSLSSVIELMGKKFVTPVARKILATLQTTHCVPVSEEYLTVQVNSWDVFVQTVKIEELGPLLATIIVSLLPFLEFLPSAIARIFNYLIVKNEDAVKDFLPSLIFIPDHPLLNQVKAKLKKYISFESENLREKLIRETSLALHETVGVRIEGLKALQLSLKKFSVDVQNLIIGSDEPDPCIKTLLEGLVICCGDSDNNISSLAASCLGQLGAVDPGLLPRKPKPKNSLPLSVHDSEFAYLALTKISRGFQNARNSVDMDAFAIAIQELLKMYQIGPTAENGIWSRFPAQVQNLMTPMLSSWYKVQAPKRDAWPDVVFGSKGTNTHIGWASLWASKLISFCKDERAVFLFKACEPSLKRDTKVLLFFLQYILLQAIIRDSSVHDTVIKEMEAVINYSPQNIEKDDFKIKTRPIRLMEYCGYPNMRSTITESEAKNCSMTVFLLIDFLQSWLRVYRSVLCTNNGDHLQKRDYVIVKDFLEKVDYLKIAIANYEIGEYPRAIMYLEDVIMKTENLAEHLPLLSKAYALYGDLDSVAGSSTFQKTAPKIEDLLLCHQVSGQLEEVRIIYEKLGKDGLLPPFLNEDLVQCYLKLGEPYTALNYINSFTREQPNLMSTLSERMAECLIKLGDYSQLDKFLSNDEFFHRSGWFTQVGNLLVNVRKNEKEKVCLGLSDIRMELAKSLNQVGVRFNDYHQGYYCLVKLQILNEIEQVSEIMNKSTNKSEAIKQMIEEWNLKFSIVQSDHASLESLLSMRRVLLNILKETLSAKALKVVEDEVAKNWVKSSEIARKAGCFNQAYNYILNAEQYNIPSTFIEKAQLYWDKNDQDLCLLTLSRGIKEFFPDASVMKSWPAGEKLEERKMCAEAKLLYAIYNEETSNCDHNTNMTNYQSAFEVCRQLEKTEAFLGQCLDRVVQHIDSNEQEQRKVCELKVVMVHHFGKSLMYGCEYIYQTVPRMLSIWLDLGERVDTEEKLQALLKLNKIIQGFLDSLPAFVFMTALPQLLSRLGHPNQKVFQLLKNILGLLVLSFPQQCLWAIQAVAKSSVSERVQRYNEFIHDSVLRSTELFKLIGDFTSLCDKLNKLTNRNLSQETAFCGLKVSSIVKELPQLLSSEKFSAIIIPITRFCSISLPRNVMSSSHEPFPKQAVYITGIEEEVTVLQSLQRPRKISFRGSDGKLYDILCKPKDDLRRDGRLMEFNNIVNMYLHRDPESRLRRLHIRTYVVTPLGENGGLLEWVPNLTGLRQVLIKLYKQFGKYVKTREVKRNECVVRDTLEKKRKIFVEKLLVLHPALFPEWFRLTFPDPSGWYIARESYVRTTAVMSMVGYILGLGDRHGENILFDSESGDTVHVDFNCLFNKGEKFEWKERVPFRLTHNMVAAMGPFGVEGTFRKSCEISLRVLRSQAKTLMSVLTPFAYDPFGSWGKNKEIVQNERDQKIGEAFSELSDIEKRLNGSLRVKQKQSTVYLSVEGQVRSLIIEATDIDNLCQMYFGWGAYL